MEDNGSMEDIPHLSARSMVTSDQMLNAIPKQSKPGPMLALDAGTRTTTRLRSIAASLIDASKRHGNGENTINKHVDNLFATTGASLHILLASSSINDENFMPENEDT